MPTPAANGASGCRLAALVLEHDQPRRMTGDHFVERQIGRSAVRLEIGVRAARCDRETRRGSTSPRGRSARLCASSRQSAARSARSPRRSTRETGVSPTAAAIVVPWIRSAGRLRRSPLAGRIGRQRIVVCSAQRSRIGITHRHAASTASRRMNSVASPAITSSSSRSYASGDDGAERAAVVEVHLHRVDADARSRHLRADAEREPLVGLNADRSGRSDRAAPPGRR